jgi:hypothetical protein
LLNELKLGEDDDLESPRRICMSGASGHKRGRPNGEHEDWLKTHGQTLSFVENEGVGGISVSISPPVNKQKGGRLLFVVEYILLRLLFVCCQYTDTSREWCLIVDGGSQVTVTCVFCVVCYDAFAVCVLSIY